MTSTALAVAPACELELRQRAAERDRHLQRDSLRLLHNVSMIRICPNRFQTNPRESTSRALTTESEEQPKVEMDGRKD